jgi:hypothetical protein
VTKVALSGGAYEARSVVAAAQRSLNLYGEPLPEALGEPAKVANYPTPGSVLAAVVGPGPIRGIKPASNGSVYVVSGSGVYYLNATGGGDLLGSITAGLVTPVSMADNTLTLVIVDGTSGGWTVDLATNAFAPLSDPTGAFVGADHVSYLDTFLIFNKPGTPQLYWTQSLSIEFDPLDFANKSAYTDNLATHLVVKREIWLIGTVTTEIWYDTGATDTGAGSSQFAPVQSVFVDHGTIAKYSPAGYDNSCFWLTSDRQGHGFVVQGSGYQTKRVSTYAIEAAFQEYPRIDDAIGMTYQIAGHSFYVLTFPTADKTWVYDATTGLWHEWAWIDSNGVEHRHRANCSAPAYGQLLLIGDWQNGNIYTLDNAVFTDNGAPIKRLRSFPHMLADGKRVFYRQFLADMDTGRTDFGVIREISLRWSDDRGHSFGNPVLQPIGDVGEYRTSLQFQRLGMARDRVWELSWSVPMDTALLGAWVDATVASS